MPFTSSELVERAIQRRAVEAVIWGMPIVNFDLMFQAAKGLKADFNQIVYWSRLPDWKNQTLTPNPDSIYLMPFFNTKMLGRLCWRFPRRMTERSWDPSWTAGRPPSKMLVLPVWTKAKAANI